MLRFIRARPARYRKKEMAGNPEAEATPEVNELLSTLDEADEVRSATRLPCGSCMRPGRLKTRLVGPNSAKRYTAACEDAEVRWPLTTVRTAGGQGRRVEGCDGGGPESFPKGDSSFGRGQLLPDPGVGLRSALATLVRSSTPSHIFGLTTSPLQKPENLMSRGTRVIVQNLVSRSDLNGETAQVVMYMEDKGRYKVRTLARVAKRAQWATKKELFA